MRIFGVGIVMFVVILVVGYIVGAKYPKLFASVPVVGGAVSG